jgi:hypothetical protein
MIATGITRVHQKSSEFLLKVELSKLVVCIKYVITRKASNTISDVKHLEKFQSPSGAILPIDGS